LAGRVIPNSGLMRLSTITYMRLISTIRVAQNAPAQDYISVPSLQL
jgi:hypothetical protein